MEDKDMQLITQRFDAITTNMNTQFAGVNARLDKINGRVGKTEDEIRQAMVEREGNRQKQEDYFKQIDELYVKVEEIDKKEQNHVSICPVSPKLGDMDKRVRVLEDQNLAVVSRSGLIKSAIAMLAVIVSIIIGTMKIVETTASANTNYLQKQNDSIMKNQTLLIKEIRNEKTNRSNN